MNTEVKEENVINEFEKIYTEQYQRCSIIGWNLAIYLNQFNVDLSSLPEPVAESIKCMVTCRKIVESHAHESSNQTEEAPLEQFREELSALKS